MNERGSHAPTCVCTVLRRARAWVAALDGVIVLDVFDPAALPAGGVALTVDPFSRAAFDDVTVSRLSERSDTPTLTPAYDESMATIRTITFDSPADPPYTMLHCGLGQGRSGSGWHCDSPTGGTQRVFTLSIPTQCVLRGLSLYGRKARTAAGQTSTISLHVIGDGIPLMAPMRQFISYHGVPDGEWGIIDTVFPEVRDKTFGRYVSVMEIRYVFEAEDAGYAALDDVRYRCDNPTPTPTLTPTLTPTPREGNINCRVSTNQPTEIYATGLDLLNRSAPVGFMPPQTEITVWLRFSQTSPNIVKGFYNGQDVWFDSGDGRVALVAGNCTLDFDPTVPVVPTPNPNVRPVFSYPLSYSPTIAATAHMGYHFAIANARYASTGGRHPGHDFFLGPLDDVRASDGVSVHAVADGVILGFSINGVLTLSDELKGLPNFNVGGLSPLDNLRGNAFVLVRHGNALVIYSHLSASSLGNLNIQTLRRGDFIGRIATDSNGAHLHLEVRTYGSAPMILQDSPPPVVVDPYLYFNADDQALINQTLRNRRDGDGFPDPNARRTRCLRLFDTAAVFPEVSAVRAYRAAPDVMEIGYYAPTATPQFGWRPNAQPLSGGWEIPCGF
jgi:murein DD-endopeptidase MepM/ murein hydrolase activator NlpD